MLFLFVRVERVTERTHAHMVLEGLSTAPIRSSVSLISLAPRVFSSLADPSRIQKKRKKKNLFFMYTSYLSCNRLRGTWTVIPAENNTSFSPVKPSVRPHHREQALRIHDIISLPGKVVHSIFLTTLHCSKVLQQGAKKVRNRR